MLLPLTTSKSSSFTVCGTGVALLLDEFSDDSASTELLLEPASTDVEDSGTASEEEPVGIRYTKLQITVVVGDENQRSLRKSLLTRNPKE